MDKNPKIAALREFGLTPDEAHLYLHLLQVKAANVRDLAKDPAFQGKWRSNLYKTIGNLYRKKFLTEEEKAGKKLIFPIPPGEALQMVIQSHEEIVQKLRTRAKSTAEVLESEFQRPQIDLSAFPLNWQALIKDLVDPRWIIREPPRITDLKTLGVEYSVEYDTLRRFGAHSAGLVIYEFRFPEHKVAAIPRILAHLQDHMANALESAGPHGFLKLKKFWFEPTSFQEKFLPYALPITQLVTKWNLPGTFRGSFAVLNLEKFPCAAVSIWGADHKDFVELLKNITSKYQVNLG